MSALITAAQMRTLEHNVINSGAVTGLELMERAGRGVVNAIFEQWPDLSRSDHLAVVLCGPGNNGGDGFVIARLLRLWGWSVDVYLMGDPDDLPADARHNYDRWRELGTVQDLTTLTSGAARDRLHSFQSSSRDHPPMVIDALFGAGLNRPLPEGLISPATECVSGIETPVHCVGVDGPSGLCLDSGRALAGVAMRCDLTVSFDFTKLGHVLSEGPSYCGFVRIADIGVRSKAGLDANIPRLIDISTDSETAFPVSADALQKTPQGHKYTNGHALVLTGGLGHTGAARLAARAALRSGAGLVTLGVPPSAQLEVAGNITALMMARVADSDELLALLDDPRFTSLCLGPGLGHDRVRDLVPAALKDPRRSVVLDADALSAFADNPDDLFDQVTEKTVLTPHGGEFARLFPDLAAALRQTPVCGPAVSRTDVVQSAARRAGCTVLLKGPDTVIATPDGRCGVHAAHYRRTAPWLATAGSGDVLAGIICGLMARGFDPFEAASSATWLHVECARSFGPGLIAEDLPEALPAVFRNLISS